MKKCERNIYIFLLLGLSIFCTACNGKAKKADSTEIQENITEAPEESQHTRWKIVEKKKYYCIEKMGLRKYNDYFKCTVYNEQQDAIYSEILGEFNTMPMLINVNSVRMKRNYTCITYGEKNLSIGNLAQLF